MLGFKSFGVGAGGVTEPERPALLEGPGSSMYTSALLALHLPPLPPPHHHPHTHLTLGMNLFYLAIPKFCPLF